jgi:phenylacetate-CoA ligase
VFERAALTDAMRRARRAPFYRALFSKAGVPRYRMSSREDLARSGTFTTGADLEQGYSQFLAVPKQLAVHVMKSAGTTGKPKWTVYSNRDWDRLCRVLRHANELDGLCRGDVAQILFNSGTPAWATGNILAAGLERTGLLVVPTGNSMSAVEQLEIMETFGTTVLYSTPSYLARITAEGKRLRDLSSLGMKLIKVGAEPSSIEFMIIEILDPGTGEPVAQGELGEVVVTTLERRAMPLIRYRSISRS